MFKSIFKISTKFQQQCVHGIHQWIGKIKIPSHWVRQYIKFNHQVLLNALCLWLWLKFWQYGKDLYLNLGSSSFILFNCNRDTKICIQTRFIYGKKMDQWGRSPLGQKETYSYQKFCSQSTGLSGRRFANSN